MKSARQPIGPSGILWTRSQSNRVTCMLRFVAISLLVSICALCQTFNARITGTVTDATGAPGPAATVSVRHVETNVTKKTKTASSGVYNVPLLLPGTYGDQVEAPGMEVTNQPGLKLKVNAAATVA